MGQGAANGDIRSVIAQSEMIVPTFQQLKVHLLAPLAVIPTFSVLQADPDGFARSSNFRYTTDLIFVDGLGGDLNANILH